MVMAVAAPAEKEGGRRLGNKPYLIARTPSADLGTRPPALVLPCQKYHLGTSRLQDFRTLGLKTHKTTVVISALSGVSTPFHANFCLSQNYICANCSYAVTYSVR